MSFRYFVIGSGSIGRRHAENLTTLGAEITHYGWRGIDLDAALSEIAACNGQAGVVIATATKVRLPLITECAKTGAALYIENPSPIEQMTFNKFLLYRQPHWNVRSLGS